jgi:hypothetical protein
MTMIEGLMAPVPEVWFMLLVAAGIVLTVMAIREL